MTVYLLSDKLIFPHPNMADPNGLLAVGGDLGADRLLLAYENGIFPWYSEGDPILWFSPDPRLVIYPGKMYVSKKLGKIIRAGVFDIRFDTVFEEVIRSCAEVRRSGQNGTWITEDMIDSYIELHELGYAHSVEAFLDGRLAGGLYGVSLGGAFFGESMFHDESNASKVTLFHLARRLAMWDFDFIDAQVPNNHMKSLGGVEVERGKFLLMLEKALRKETRKGAWSKQD